LANQATRLYAWPAQAAAVGVDQRVGFMLAMTEVAELSKMVCLCRDRQYSLNATDIVANWSAAGSGSRFSMDEPGLACQLFEALRLSMVHREMWCNAYSRCHCRCTATCLWQVEAVDHRHGVTQCKGWSLRKACQVRVRAREGEERRRCRNLQLIIMFLAVRLFR
jgi:hypothetical protein